MSKSATLETVFRPFPNYSRDWTEYVNVIGVTIEPFARLDSE